jgi:hypothetical protein
MAIYTILGHRKQFLGMVEAKNPNSAFYRALEMVDAGKFENSRKYPWSVTPTKPTAEEFEIWNALKRPVAWEKYYCLTAEDLEGWDWDSVETEEAA